MPIIILINVPRPNSIAERQLGAEKTSPSKIQTLLSRLHVAMYAPELDHATHFTSFSCPSSMAMHSNSDDDDLLLQMDVVPSKLDAARSLPHGDQLTQRIVRR